MTSSLAQQLQKLKVTQKDEIRLPDRTKVSFLFDIKQAANVDDQTLYYICLGGLRDIAQQIPELSKQLLAFQSDILNEKSLEFYRGTLTKDTLTTVDDQLKLLIKLLAPYFLNTATHKVLEYLIRVYEIHAFHKHLLILSFLPYFETTFFLRMIQLLNIKQDELMYFMEPFAFSGDALDQKSLIKGLARNNGTLFTKYAEYCFKLSNLHMSISQNIDNCLHWKFFGTMLVEILRSNKEDETLLFNVLPFISQGLKLPIHDLRTASLMGISQIVCRKTLTKEYSVAFFRQVLYYIGKDTVTDEDIEHGILVMVLLTQYQRLDTLTNKDMETLSNIQRVNKHMRKVHEQHDITTFLIIIVKTLLLDQSFDIREYIAILKDCFNLKSIYTAIETVIALSVSNEGDNTLHERCHEILIQLKHISEQDFNQAIIFLLKQASLNEDQRDQIVSLLHGKNQQSHLVSKFGDKEYSLLSSLASSSKITKMNALNALLKAEFSSKLSKNEKDLIKISLSQLIIRNTEEEAVIQKVIDAFVSLIDFDMINETEFDTLEQFIESNVSCQRYSQNIIDSIIKVLLKLKVTDKNERDNKQLMMGFSFGQIHSLYSKFSIQKSNGQQNSVSEFIMFAVKNFQLSTDFALNLIKSPKSWINQAHVTELVQQIIDKNTASQEQINQFNINIVEAIAQSTRDNSAILTLVITKLKKSTVSQDKLLSKLIGQCLVQKQKNKQFDLRGLLQVLFTQIMGGSQQKLAEFFIKLAIESKNEVKQVFAIISLTQIIKQKPISPQIFMISAIVLLQSPSQQVRLQTLNMVEAFNSLKDDGHELQVFNNTPKPQSSKKSTDKQDFTPMKVQPLQKLLRQLVAMKHEIVQDAQQTVIALNGSAHKNIIDSSVRFLLDLPSTKLKNKFMVALKALTTYSIIFGMSLQEQLNKEYFTLKQKKQLTDLDVLYIANIGSLIEKMALSKSNDAHEEFISSLVFPYLHFTFGIKTPEQPLPNQIEQQVTLIFVWNLLRSDILKSLKVEHTISILKLYVQSQIILFSKIFRQRIRDTLILQTQVEGGNLQVLTDKHVMPIIMDAKDKLSKSQNLDQEVIIHLEIVLETLTQVRVQNEVNLMETILDIVMILGRRSNQQSIYLIELCVQLCIQIIQGTQKIKGNTQKTIQLVNDLITSQMQSLNVQIDAILNTKDVDANDPFQQFIMEVDSGSKVTSNDEDDKLLTILQVVSSICNLLLQFEINVLINSEETQKYLEELSKLLQTVIQDERSKSAKGRLLIGQLFRFYHQQVLRATKVSSKKNVDVKLMLSTFIESSLIVQNYGFNQDEVYQFVSSVTNETQLSAFVCLLLIAHGKDSVQVKDDLQLDSTEIKIVQRLFIESSNLLMLFEELLFLVTAVELSESVETFVRQRFNIIFESELVSQRMDQTQWVFNRLVKDHKSSRKIKYLAVYLMNEWISSNVTVQRSLSFATKEQPEESNNLFYSIYLTSSVLNESISQALQVKDQEDEKKVKKSLKRLYSRIQDFQKNLNNLLSYEVQVSIVLKVLNEFKDQKQTMTMRTTTIQLLINKTPQFAQSLSKVQEKEMIIVFSPLIAHTIDILQGMLGQFTGKANNEKQNYIMALLSLLQRTASTFLNGETKAKIVSLVLGLSAHMHQLSMMVHSQLMLTAMTLFEVHHLDLLEHLQKYFVMLVDSFSRVQQHLQNQDFFVDSFTKTLLKASLSLCAFFSKFMTATQYEAIIKHVIVITRPAYYQEVKAVLDVVSKESTKNVGFKLVFQAMLNSYDEVITTRITDENHTSADVSTIILRYFEDLLTPVIQRVKKEFIVENHLKIFEFFKDAFSISYTYQKTHGHIDMPQVTQVDEAIAQSYQQFVVKMNEDQLRPLIVKQTKWAFKANNQGEGFPYNLHKVISFLRSMNCLLNGLREFFVPLMPLYFERVIGIVSFLGEQKEQTSQKRKREQIEFNAEDKESHTFYELLKLAISNMQLNFLYDNMSFIQNDTFEKISEPLARLVTLTQIGGQQYVSFVEDILKPGVYDLVERINNDDMWKKINYDILMHTRNAQPQVRLAAFKIVEHLFNRIGERYLILLNDTIPFLSEGMEDENTEVEICAKAIVARIEQMTGDSIHEYLK